MPRLFTYYVAHKVVTHLHYTLKLKHIYYFTENVCIKNYNNIIVLWKFLAVFIY